MSEAIERKIITVLLDKYERSSFFKTNTTPTKRILLKLYEDGKCEFSDYNIENSEQRIRINECVQALAKEELIHFDWMKGEKNHIISKVWLNTDHLPRAYCFARRQPQSDLLSGIDLELKECMTCVNTQWMQNYLLSVREYIAQKKKLHPLVPENVQERKSLLQALRYIDENKNNELLKRVFSVRCFGESKYFERAIEARLLRILRKYLDADNQVSDDQLLNQIGIVKYPEQFEFCGGVILESPDGQQIDFGKLFSGTIYRQDIATSKIVFSENVHSILSIENKANYFDYIGKSRKTDEFVIYHSGQYSPTKRLFLQAVAEASKDIPWYHWGDIDYGGFSMLARLRREINASIKPYRMNVQELILYESFTASFSSEYATKLQELKTRPELGDCTECICYMLVSNKRLEQEALLE